MAAAYAHRRFSGRGITMAFRLEVSEVLAQCATQRARAERQRTSAASMRKEAHAMRSRMRFDWLRAP
jgi:hypothetical protein